MKRYVFLVVLFVATLSGCASNQTWTNDAPDQPISKKSSLKSSKIQASNDLWERIRDGYDIPDPEIEIIDRHVRQLQSNPAYVDRLLQRSSAYIFYIIEEVEARDMPSELALLPFVESAFNPKAVSPVKASGMWQFMPATGRDYNLKQNIFRDERGDIVKSTRAALDYLQKLYDQFGDWQLALAAYNWGEGNVSRAIAKNEAAGLPTDYFSISMPNETRNYVPKLLAYKRVIEDPKRYGFVLPKVENHPYFVAIPVTRDIDVDKVVELSEISKEQFLALNPSYTKPVILKGFNQEILLPYGKAEIFKKNLKSNKTPLTSWTAVKVEKTDTVDKVAANIGVDASDIREINNIPKGMKIRAGSSILVPKGPEHMGDVPTEIAQNATLNLEKEYVPIPVVMKCHGKKCVAVPSNLANYNSKYSQAPSKKETTTRADNNKKDVIRAKNSGNSGKAELVGTKVSPKSTQVKSTQVKSTQVKESSTKNTGKSNSEKSKKSSNK